MTKKEKFEQKTIRNSQRGSKVRHKEFKRLHHLKRKYAKRPRTL